MTHHLAVPVHHITEAPSLIRWFQFIIYLEHAPSFGDSGSSYNLNTSPPPPSFGDSGSSHMFNTTHHLAVPVHHITEAPSLIRWFQFIIYLEHAPSFGDSGSSYNLNNSPPPLIWRFRFIIYVQHDPSFAVPVHHITEAPSLIRWFQFIIYLEHAPSFGDSGSSYNLNTSPPPHLAIPVHFCLTRPIIWRFRFTISLKHPPLFGGSNSSYILNTPRPSFGDAGSSYILSTPRPLSSLLLFV